MDSEMIFIREAKAKDASRIAEILVFSKRTHYRRIFQDDAFSFGDLQVLSAAQNLLVHPKTLASYTVYDDGFVKGLILLKDDEIAELYVDPFFERQGIGSALMAYALEKILHPRLWVLDGNDNAVRFYQKQGFRFTGEKQFVPGTDKTESRMMHAGPVTGDLSKKVVRVIVDRQLGSVHPDFPDMIYPVNYGYVEGVPGGDGEDQDAYILGIQEPVTEMVGRIAAVIHRENDNEDKWVVIPIGSKIRSSDILKNTAFTEQYFRSSITLM
jgi:putative acetyltransferase